MTLRSLIWLIAQLLSPTLKRCQTLNYSGIYWVRGHIRHPVALGQRAGHLARLLRRLPRLLRGHRCPVAARYGDTGRVLRDPGTALRGADAHLADDPAGRGLIVEQEPGLTRGGPSRGAWLDPSQGLPDRPARPARRADRRRVRRAGGGRARPRGAGPPDPVRPAHPRPGRAARGDKPGDPGRTRQPAALR